MEFKLAITTDSKDLDIEKKCISAVQEVLRNSGEVHFNSDEKVPFKPYEWLVDCRNGEACYITDIMTSSCQLVNVDGECRCIDFGEVNRFFRKWYFVTDVKPGMLVVSNDFMCIGKSIIGGNIEFMSYCSISRATRNFYHDEKEPYRIEAFKPGTYKDWIYFDNVLRSHGYRWNKDSLELVRTVLEYNIGDFVVYNGGNTYHVDDIKDDMYLLSNHYCDCLPVPFSSSDTLKKWRLVDVKPGDFLTLHEGVDTITAIIDRCDLNIGFITLCYVVNNEFYMGNYERMTTSLWFPASKDEVNHLLCAMNKSGYRLDRKSNTLEAIGCKFNVGDVIISKVPCENGGPSYRIIDITDSMIICDRISFPIYQQDEYEIWRCKSPVDVRKGSWYTCIEKTDGFKVGHAYQSLEDGWISNDSDARTIHAECFRPWVLEWDAKPGDMMEEFDGRYPFIFRESNDNGRPIAIGGVNCRGNFVYFTNLKPIWTNVPVHPASKDNKMVIADAMRERGLKFDRESLKVVKLNEEGDQIDEYVKHLSDAQKRYLKLGEAVDGFDFDDQDIIANNFFANNDVKSMSIEDIYRYGIKDAVEHVKTKVKYECDD